MKELIEENGGFVVDSFTKKVTHVLAAPDEAQKTSTKSAKAKENNIPIVTEAFIEDCIKEKKLLDVENFKLDANAVASSSTDSKKRKQKEEEKEEEEEEKEEPEPEKKMQKVVAKGGAAVDHRSGLSGTGTIFSDASGVWNGLIFQITILWFEL